MPVTTRKAAAAGGSGQGRAARAPRGEKSARHREHGGRAIQLVLAENVRRHRLARRWSIETLAARSEFTPAFIEQVEQGRRRDVRLGSMERLARALQVEVVALLLSRGARARGRRIKAPGDQPRQRRAP